MPHSLFLGSALATQDRVSYDEQLQAKTAGAPPESEKSSLNNTKDHPTTNTAKVQRWIYNAKEYIIGQFRAPPPSEYSSRAKSHSERENRPLPFVQAHIYHGIVDVVLSLLGFAVLINSL